MSTAPAAEAMAPAHPLDAYARALLLRADRPPEPGLVEAFLRSPHFRAFAAVADIKLLAALDSFADGLAGLDTSRTAARPPDDLEQAPAATAHAIDTPPIANEPESEPAMPSARPIFSDLYFRLPNAREGEPYAQALTAQAGDPPGFVIDTIALPDDLGLTADIAHGGATVSGTPRRAGEHEIVVSYRFTDQAAPEPRQARFHFLVNPDPKSMWLNLPSPADDPYWKPDQDSAASAGPAFRLLAASKRGRSHAHKGGFRDDHFSIGYLPASDWYVAAVADGAGSARYSRRGAQLICEEAERHLAATLNGAAGAGIDLAAQAFHLARAGDAGTENPAALESARAALHQHLCAAVGHAAYHALKAIHEEAARHADLEASIKDYASTAMISACKRYPFGTLCAAYWVGDGAVAVYRAGHDVTLLGAVDGGEYSGQTKFLEAAEVTQEALMRRTRFALVDDMTALIVMTDGVSDPRFETDSALARLAAWDRLWQELEQALDLSGADDGARQERLLAWLDFWSPGNHDDRTIALVYRDGRP